MIRHAHDEHNISQSGKASISRTIQSKDGVGLVMEPTVSDSIPLQKPAARERPKMRRYEDDQMRRYAVSRDTARAYKNELGRSRVQVTGDSVFGNRNSELLSFRV